MVDVIEYLESIDNQSASIAIIIIMIIQSPIPTFPGYILMIYAGFKLGLIKGMIINYIGLYSSCIIGYRFGRWSSSDLSKNPNQLIVKFHNWIEVRGLKLVIFLRILPLIPNNITSIGSGFSGIPEKQHAMYSGFGIIQSFLWSFIGSYLLKSAIDDLELELTTYHVALFLLFIMVIFYVRYRLRSNKP